MIRATPVNSSPSNRPPASIGSNSRQGSESSLSDMASGNTPRVSGDWAGVGMRFEADRYGTVWVAKLEPGGAAAAEGQIQVRHSHPRDDARQSQKSIP